MDSLLNGSVLSAPLIHLRTQARSGHRPTGSGRTSKNCVARLRGLAPHLDLRCANFIDGDDLSVAGRTNWQQTGAGRFAIDTHSARAALRDAAVKLGLVMPYIAQHTEERGSPSTSLVGPGPI